MLVYITQLISSTNLRQLNEVSLSFSSSYLPPILPTLMFTQLRYHNEHNFLAPVVDLPTHIPLVFQFIF